MVETFKGTPYDSGLDQNLLAEIADYFRPIRDEIKHQRNILHFCDITTF